MNTPRRPRFAPGAAGTPNSMTRRLRLLAAFVALALALPMALVAALAIAPASYAAGPRTDNGDGWVFLKTSDPVEPGGKVEFGGNGFTPGVELSIKIDDGAVTLPNGDQVIATVTAGADGKVSGSVTLPASTPEGDQHWLRFLGAGVSKHTTTKEGADAFFTVKAPVPSSDPTVFLKTSGSIAPGGGISFGGSGFTPGAEVTVKLDGVTVLGTVTALDSGKVTGTMTLPADATEGTHWLHIAGAGASADTPAFTVAKAAAPTPKPESTGTESVRIATASPVAAGDTLAVAGKGFVPGKAVAVKLDDADQLVTTPATLTVGADGRFSGNVMVPAGTTNGWHWLRFLSAASDGSGISKIATFAVGSQMPAGPAPTPEGAAAPVVNGTCSSGATAQVTFPEPVVKPGGQLHVVGSGWCASTGGSVLGVKIDGGAYSRLDTSVLASKPDTWAIIRADSTGAFDVRITLPDGTAKTSTPAMLQGAHTLTLLTGSLKDGDVQRSIESPEFIVGKYRPNGLPDPVKVSQLSTGVTAKVVGDTLHVRVTGGEKGDWVFLSGLAPDGSPRYPWGETWFRLGAGGRLVTDLGSVPMMGENRLVVQSGNQGEIGRLLGWASVVFPGGAAPTTSTTPSTTHGTSTASSGSPAATTPGATPAAVGTTTDPAPPVQSYADLKDADKLMASLVGTVWSAKVPNASGPLFIYVYDRSRAIPAGWIAADADKLIRVDLRDLPTAAYRVSVQDASGRLLGWGNADLTAAVAETESDEAPASVPEVAALAAAAPVGWLGRHLSATDGWMLGLGAALLGGVGIGAVTRRGGAA
ncbi:hypothetical protein AB3X52_03410 [Nocardioides sp. DS6]|uniref:Ig-like domain repeat protein n=1 Tax=Nocardioides eburneus TaxID=3231482 RepID=A0ABV3SXB3_9ACTN